VLRSDGRIIQTAATTRNDYRKHNLLFFYATNVVGNKIQMQILFLNKIFNKV